LSPMVEGPLLAVQSRALNGDDRPMTFLPVAVAAL